MSNSYFFISYKLFIKIFLSLVFFVLLICIFFIPNISAKDISILSNNTDSLVISDDEYIWPIPGYTSITSPFGKRYSPTKGASSYHKGIDIGAPKGTQLFAVTSGEIVFTGFLGGGGYTITLKNENYKFTYCHVSPNYVVKEGELVKKGQLIRACWT